MKNVFNKPPPTLAADDLVEILRWAQVHEESNPLLRAGAERNALRWASAYGAIVLAELLRRGIVDPGECPVAALCSFLDNGISTKG